MTPPRSFGVFAREALLTGGYEDDDVMQFSSQQVISAAENTRDTLVIDPEPRVSVLTVNSSR